MGTCGLRGSRSWSLNGLGMQLDVHETKDELLIKADLPGINRDDVHITLEDGTLRIEAEKKEEKTEDGEDLVHERAQLRQVFPPDRDALPRSV